MNEDRLILDLCGGTGSWSKPYRDAGYEVWLVDLHATVMDPRCRVLDMDIRDFVPPPQAWGVLMAPPCTMFARSGARWWAEKGAGPLEDALQVVDACVNVARSTNPRWWALENPAGRLKDHLGPPKLRFQPWEYGHPTSKHTCLWGRFTVPTRTPVAPTAGEVVHSMGPSPLRPLLRSVTPAPFAQAFFRANP